MSVGLESSWAGSCSQRPDAIVSVKFGEETLNKNNRSYFISLTFLKEFLGSSIDSVWAALGRRMIYSSGVSQNSSNPDLLESLPVFSFLGHHDATYLDL